MQVQVQPQTRGKGWWLHPPTQGGDSAPPCERIEGVAEEAVEEAVDEAHPKKLTATHEGVVIKSREENRVGWTHRIPSIHARTCHGP